jgi:hypothetical protein
MCSEDMLNGNEEASKYVTEPGLVAWREVCLKDSFLPGL